MKMIKPALLGTLMVPAFILAAGTANAENTTTMDATYLTSTPDGAFHADSLTGNQVKSSVEDDEDIGTINDLVIDEDGQIHAVVISVGGFLGMGEKDVAVAWDSLELVKDDDGDDYVIRVNASQDALEAAEEYERNTEVRERNAEMHEKNVENQENN
ncbi:MULTISPECIES: PRC-barrel domain-containing protein [Vreelandella]|uniref:PRC-barrel domain containing protein n=2 Tax=Vreelandella TaxID=3137766 RepID=A0A7C9JUK3_9GAMM|nr:MULTISPECIES: PRC-barrel domain-containing protein [Halomonas]NDL71623.1 PRC-barrel domain containing protein [Halomonas alkaliphila]NYS44857.1 PRC-barrel domain-containing protein [Halomonas zhaodongensis]